MPISVVTRHSAYGTLLKGSLLLITRHSTLPIQASLTHSSLVTRHSLSPYFFFPFVTRHSSLIFPPFCLFFCHSSLVTRHSIFPHSLSFLFLVTRHSLFLHFSRFFFFFSAVQLSFSVRIFFFFYRSVFFTCMQNKL